MKGRLALLLLAGCPHPPTQTNPDAGGTGADAGAPLADGGSQDAGSGPDSGFACATPASVCSSDGWCWESPLPHGNPISGLWATSASDIWAVGASGLITHSDGQCWAGAASPTEQNLHAIWGAGPCDLWAVGDFGTMLRWDCASWTVVPNAPGTSDLSTMESIWGSQSNDVWTVGDEGAFHWDGGAWDAVPAPGTSSLSLAAVWGDAPDDFWAVGRTGAAIHFNGAAWTAPEQTSLALDAVWGSSGQVWAAGDGGVLIRAAPGNWTPALTCASGTFSALWGTSGSDLWAAASGGGLFHSMGGSAPTDCDAGGGSWSQLPFAPVDLLSGTSLAANQAWVGGAGGTVAHWDGGVWTTEAGASTGTLRAVDGNPAQVLAAGTSGFFVRGVSGGWSQEGSGSIASLRADPASSAFWALDDSGHVWHRDAAGWVQVAALAGTTGEAIWVTDSQVWAVGLGGTAWESTNTNPPAFVPRSAGLNATALFALWGPVDAGNAMWAVGAGGTFFALDGGGWSSEPSGAASDLQAIWADAPSGKFFVAGAGGIVAVGSASQLTTYCGTPTIATLRALWGSSANDVWAVGDDGKILHQDVTGVWTLSSSATVNALYSVAGFAGGADLYAVGAFGTVLHRR